MPALFLCKVQASPSPGGCEREVGCEFGLTAKFAKGSEACVLTKRLGAEKLWERAEFRWILRRT
jgi:hypothetical protein